VAPAALTVSVVQATAQAARRREKVQPQLRGSLAAWLAIDSQQTPPDRPAVRGARVAAGHAEQVDRLERRAPRPCLCTRRFRRTWYLLARKRVRLLVDLGAVTCSVDAAVHTSVAIGVIVERLADDTKLVGRRALRALVVLPVPVRAVRRRRRATVARGLLEAHHGTVRSLAFAVAVAAGVIDRKAAEVHCLAEVIVTRELVRELIRAAPIGQCRLWTVAECAVAA
jgi:hypothetical protein